MAKSYFEFPPLCLKRPPPVAASFRTCAHPRRESSEGVFRDWRNLAPASPPRGLFHFPGFRGREARGWMPRAHPRQRPRGRKAGGEGLRPADVEGRAGTRLHAGEGPFWFFSPRFLFSLSLQPEAEARGRPGGVAARGRDLGAPRSRGGGGGRGGGRGPEGPAQRGCPGRSAGARGAAGAGGD